jgi:hypothetical protein
MSRPIEGSHPAMDDRNRARLVERGAAVLGCQPTVISPSSDQSSWSIIWLMMRGVSTR